MIDKNEIIGLLRKSKKITIDDKFEELYALDRGIIFISEHEYSGNINFKITGKNFVINGSGNIYSAGDPIKNYKERGIILYKNPEETHLVGRSTARIYKIIPDKLSSGSFSYSSEIIENMKEKQHPFFRSTRPWSFQQSIAAVLIGTILAFHINIIYFILSLIAVVLAQGAFNIINGYYDYKSGNDTLTSMTSTRVFIDKIINSKKAINMSLVMLFIAGAIGIYLSYYNPLLIVFISIGTLSGIIYSMPKYGFKRLALGDLSILIIWGPGILLGSYIIQGGIINTSVILISLSIGILTTNILHGNNWRDIKDDSENNVKTVSILLKQKGSEIYYLALLWIPYLLIFMAYVISPMYYPVLAAFITIPIAFRISRYVVENKQKYMNILDAITAKFTLFFAFSSFTAYVIIYYLNGLLTLKL